jgi:hypothetical protein
MAWHFGECGYISGGRYVSHAAWDLKDECYRFGGIPPEKRGREEGGRRRSRNKKKMVMMMKTKNRLPQPKVKS